MNNNISNVDFTTSYPPALKNDPEMLALAKTLAKEHRKTISEIKHTIIYARIDELPEQLLDVLAVDLYIDWYDYEYPLEVKRAIIKDSIKIHRRLGTKYAVKTALGNVFPGTKVEEWFEYGGDPYMFRVVIGATSTGVSLDKQNAVLDKVKFYKNTRSHLESISYKIKKNATVFTGAISAIARMLEIYPYTAKTLTSHNKTLLAGAIKIKNTIDIYPDKE